MADGERMKTYPEGRVGYLLVIVDDSLCAYVCAWAWDSWGTRHWIHVVTGEPVAEAGMGVAPGGYCYWQRTPEPQGAP